MINQSARMEPSRLKEMSDTAALLYINRGIPLSKAVFHAIQGKELTSEHLKRILRAANVRAYLMEYDRADPSNRVINFEGGLADYGEIMELFDVNKEGTMPLDSLQDYTAPPEDHKLLKEMDALESQVKTAALAQPSEKLPSIESAYWATKKAEEKVASELASLENKRSFLAAEFYSLSKQAMVSEYTLGDIMRATSVGDRDLSGFLVKTAKAMPSRFWTDEEIAESMSKVSSDVVDPNNPLRRKWLELTEVVKTGELKRKTRDLLRIKKAELLEKMRGGGK